MPIDKSSGLTDTERLLANLCDQTFLRLWSYPNPWKDDGHELCDLLAVFDNHVFVFFDREGKHFQNTERDPLLNWERWKRAVVDRQVTTALGAERYLKSGRKVFLDAKRDVPFPIEMPTNRMVVHKIVVAHGAKEACASFSSDNVYGSLAVTYCDGPNPPALPFMINLDRSNPVHVLDSHNLPIILSELDTFADFVPYLLAKEAAISKYELLTYCGEEDVLGHYFSNFDSVTNEHFIGVKDSNITGVFISEGEWKAFIERPEYKNKKLADESSYLWDEIIQHTSQNALDGTLLGDADVLRGRSPIHEMAREPRFSRRALSDAMKRAIRNFPESGGRIMRLLSFMPSIQHDKGYVFLQLKVDGISDYEGDYRPKRRALLQIACGAAKNKFPHLNTIVGIAVDAPKFATKYGEDLLLMDCREWSDERRAHFEQLNTELQFFRSPTLETRQVTVQNFPSKL